MVAAIKGHQILAQLQFIIVNDSDNLLSCKTTR